MQLRACNAHSTDYIQYRIGRRPPPPFGNYGQDKYDSRSAEQIIKNPLFSDRQRIFASLPDESICVRNFFQQVGGSWSDPTLTPCERANIAANAERVLEKIENLGGRHSTPDNNRIDGLRQKTNGKSKQVYRHSKVERLLRFCEQGYSIFNDVPAGTPRPHDHLEKPTHNTGRDLNDNRSASEIIRGPLFKRLLPDSPKTAKPILDGKRVQGFYKHIGGNWNSLDLSTEEKNRYCRQRRTSAQIYR